MPHSSCFTGEHALLHLNLEKVLDEQDPEARFEWTVYVSDYRINVNQKEKTFHDNLLNSYNTRDTAYDETATASLAVVEDDDESSCNDCGCELPKLCGWGSKKTVKVW
ncbi:hypothetical protein PoB_004416600 [Plakobranchus ocellatus]|uniref:Uncharacterized protein n=1 Tax=Plakobranchus ocellatus TaxID=259542 RepID=A0AAV4BB63_9GAST|nr:hypothetical protein PoB_004416600 [Plakobranchus ocellatus]